MPMGNTDLVATKNDLIISRVQRELISKAVTMSSISDLSAFASKGMKSIEVPRAGSFTVENRATTVQAALQNVTFATDAIALDQRSNVAWQVDADDEVESSVALEAELAGRAARAHAKNFDALIIAGLEADSTSTASATGDIDKTKFLDMRQELLAAEADPSQLTFLCGPDQEAVLLGISEFVEADKYGSAVIPNGVLGRLYGVEVRMSTQIAADTYYMYDRDGYGFAIQRQPNIGEVADPRLGTTSKVKAMDMKWGHDQLQNGALLRKDANV